MRVFVGNQTPTGEMIQRECVSLIKKIIASKPPNYELGVVIHDNFGDKTGNAYFHTDHPNWNSTFQHVWIQMFPPESELQTIRKTVVDQLEIKKLRDELDKLKLLNSTKKAHNAQTAGLQPVVPVHLTRLLNAPVQSAVHKSSVPAQVQEFLPESHPLMRRLYDTPVQVVHELPVFLPVPTVNDTNVLVSAVVNQSFEEEFDNFIVKSAEAIGAENQFKMSVILGEESDANALKDEVARQAFIDESAAFTSTFAAFEVVGLVNAVTRANRSLFLDPPNLNPLARSVDPVIQPSSPVTIIDYVPVSPTDYFSPASSKTSSSKNVTPGDAESAALFAAINFPIPPLPGQPLTAPWFCANGVGGSFSVIPENKDGADQSGKSSPSQLVKDELLLPLLPLSLRSNALKTEPSELNTSLNGAILQASPSSGQNGTFLTHDCEKSSPKSSFTPAHTNQIVHSSEWTDIGVGGAHSSDIQSNSALFHVGVGRNPRANQPSFPPQGDVRRPPVQVLAQAEFPGGFPGEFPDCADHTKSPSSSKLGSDSSKVGTNPPASLLKVPKSFGTSRFVQMLLSKSSSPKERNGIGGSNPVAHSSDTMSSGSAATTTTLLPSFISPLGGNIGGIQGVHSPDDPPGFVPSPAPSSSSKLGSAAAAALSPQFCPSGHEKGGIERNEEMLDFDDWYAIAQQLKRNGVSRSQVQLFSHLALEFKGTQGIEVA
jgi:hypothetical protein